MNLEKVHSVYLVGVGGIGMSALARYFIAQGKQVAGYDRTKTRLTEALEEEGIHVAYKDDIEVVNGLNDDALVIYTPAIPQSNQILSYFRENKYQVFKRSEVLGMITRESRSVAVAGTHGKTTVSCMVAHMLKTAGLPINAFLGGIASNYNTNLLTDESAEIAVLEADEYDKSFLYLNPEFAIITSVEADHLDVYKDSEELIQTFREFSKKVKSEDHVICHASVKDQLSIPNAISYAIDDEADLIAKNVTVIQGKFQFDLHWKDEVIEEIIVGLPGRYNIENALAAIAIARLLDCSWEEIKEGLQSFKGVKRRFETHIQNNELIYIDDYAHHPGELKACISAVKELHPGKRITGVFQPHLYSRTRDFAGGFAESLQELQELLMLDIYPAREMPIAGVDAHWLLDKVDIEKKKVVEKENLIEELKALHPELILTMGAGDIDKMVEPIKEAFADND